MVFCILSDVVYSCAGISKFWVCFLLQYGIHLECERWASGTEVFAVRLTEASQEIVVTWRGTFSYALQLTCSPFCRDVMCQSRILWMSLKCKCPASCLISVSISDVVTFDQMRQNLCLQGGSIFSFLTGLVPVCEAGLVSVRNGVKVVCSAG